MKAKRRGRRQFLKEAALAGLAGGAIRSATAQTPETAPSESRSKSAWHSYGERSRFVETVRTVIGDPEGRAPALRTPLQDQKGIITPASLHYMISHGQAPPDIDPRQHRLLIHGMVDRPLVFTLDELMRLPSVTRVHFVECNSNSNPVRGRGAIRTMPTATAAHTHGFTSCSEWTGTPLSLLLQEAGVQKGASWILAEGADPRKHPKSIPLEKALDDCFVAYGQNGEPVRPEQGYPLRLLVPGWEGINNVKWLQRIKVVNQPYMFFSESPGYTSLRPDGKRRWFNFELGPKSVITRPSGGHRLPGPGFYEITGLAWSGGGAVRRVEVSTDGGRTWKDAQLQEPVFRKAHSRFVFPWDWNGEEVVLQSRSTDERGDVQPNLAQFAELWGVTGDPASFFKSPPFSVGHFNVIQPWRVNRDGSVQNAIFT